ncbi:hypothetical protein [Methylotuvimicrobium sp.]|uniref:hypothetical protein n=1 Tax=Methylotuvimicrobium sp. TaxID=2822413 RepID=UPI003D64DA16
MLIFTNIITITNVEAAIIKTLKNYSYLEGVSGYDNFYFMDLNNNDLDNISKTQLNSLNINDVIFNINLKDDYDFEVHNSENYHSEYALINKYNNGSYYLNYEYEYHYMYSPWEELHIRPFGQVNNEWSIFGYYFDDGWKVYQPLTRTSNDVTCTSRKFILVNPEAIGNNAGYWVCTDGYGLETWTEVWWYKYVTIQPPITKNIQSVIKKLYF